MMNQIVALIKQAALDAVNASYPVTVVFGRVVSIKPMQVYINQKMPSVGKDFLVITETVLKNNVQAGDKVILLRMQGGQKFIVLDKEGDNVT